MTRTDGTEDAGRPSWWRASRVWLFALLAAALALLIVGAVTVWDRPAPMSYSAFFDQLEAGNVASVTLRGTEVTGRFKRPVAGTVSTGTGQRDSFSSWVPDVGDPALVPELRRQRDSTDARWRDDASGRVMGAIA